MNMNDRVKQIRKALGMNQADFGSRIGLRNTAISKIENGENGVTDQTLVSICREFRVDERWFRSGEGEMFIAMNESEELAAYCADLINGDEPDIAKVILNWSRLSDEDKAFLRRLIRQLFGDFLQ